MSCMYVPHVTCISRSLHNNTAPRTHPLPTHTLHRRPTRRPTTPTTMNDTHKCTPPPALLLPLLNPFAGCFVPGLTFPEAEGVAVGGGVPPAPSVGCWLGGIDVGVGRSKPVCAASCCSLSSALQPSHTVAATGVTPGSAGNGTNALVFFHPVEGGVMESDSTE